MVNGVNSSLFYTAYQVHAAQNTYLMCVCLILPLTRAVVSNRNLLTGKTMANFQPCLVAALGLVYSSVVQTVRANLRNRQT